MKFLIVLLLALLFAPPALGDWDVTGTGAAWSTGGVVSSGFSVVVFEDADLPNDWSQAVQVRATSGASLCIVGGGTVSVEVYIGYDLQSALANYVPLQNASDNSTVLLSSAIPCVPNQLPNAFIRLKIVGAPTADGVVWVRAASN